MNLYEISTNYMQLLECEPEMVADTLESLKEAFKEKTINIAYVIKQMDAEQKVIAEEVKRLQERKKTAENKQKYLKQYLHDSMNATGIDKVKSPTITISIRKNPPSLDVTNEENIPEEFYQIKKELKRKDLLDYMKNGGSVEGCAIKQSTTVSIR